VTGCYDVLEMLLLARDLDPAATAHLQECARCHEQATALGRIGPALRAGTVPAPPPGLRRRTLTVAAPLLAHHAARFAHGDRRRLMRAVAAALLPLPAVLAVDAYAIRALHAFLSALLPAPVSAYLAFNFAALVVLTIALTYAAVPVLADRQIRLARRGGYA
jgi:hypothetical protein